MRKLAWKMMVAAALLPVTVTLAQARKEEYLAEEEQDKLREAQDPSERIGVYLDLAQTRLDRLARYRAEPANSPYDIEDFLNRQLDEYLRLNGELKNWIDEQAERRGDMRRGLRKLIETCPRQLTQLRDVQQAPGAHAAAYADSLREAIADASDVLDGATRALTDQQKLFADLKQEDKAAARLSKERLKQEKKRSKEERKLQKEQRRQGVPTDPDAN